MIRRQEAANCATLAPARPPRLTKAARQAGSISKPNTSNPRARKRSAIALPIRPRPINPICSRSEAAAGTTDDVCGLQGDKGMTGSLMIALDCEHTKTSDSHSESIRGTPPRDFVASLPVSCGRAFQGSAAVFGEAEHHPVGNGLRAFLQRLRGPDLIAGQPVLADPTDAVGTAVYVAVEQDHAHQNA